MTLNLDKASLKLALFDPGLTSQVVLTRMADEFATRIGDKHRLVIRLVV